MIQHGMPGHPSWPHLRLIPAPQRLETHNRKPCWRHWYAGLLLDRHWFNDPEDLPF